MILQELFVIDPVLKSITSIKMEMDRNKILELLGTSMFILEDIGRDKWPIMVAMHGELECRQEFKGAYSIIGKEPLFVGKALVMAPPYYLEEIQKSVLFINEELYYEKLGALKPSELKKIEVWM